jgi:hypothetical protein
MTDCVPIHGVGRRGTSESSVRRELVGTAAEPYAWRSVGRIKCIAIR